MSFKPNIPQPNDFLSDSQNDLLNNFTISNAVMDINHYPFSDATADKGKHKFMQMPERLAPTLPIPTTAVNEGALYTKEGTNPAETNLFFRAENSGGGGGFEYQLSKVIAGSTATFSTLQGWTFLPGGIIVQWGQKINPGTSGQILFVTNNINFPTSIYQVMLQLQHNSAANESATVRGDGGLQPSTTQFSYRTTSSSANTVLFWVAIGN